MIRRRRSFAIGGTVVAIAAISLFVFRRKPASPTVERNLVWIDTVKQGPIGSKIEQQSLVRARRITVAVQTAPKETEDTIEIVSGHAPATG